MEFEGIFFCYEITTTSSYSYILISERNGETSLEAVGSIVPFVVIHPLAETSFHFSLLYARSLDPGWKELFLKLFESDNVCTTDGRRMACYSIV
jgi:hypothetical protein